MDIKGNVPFLFQFITAGIFLLGKTSTSTYSDLNLKLINIAL